jgi:hypothetical protein
MVTYPVHVTVRPYKGSDERKRVRFRDDCMLARKLEDLINSKLLEQLDPIKVYTYGELAMSSGLAVEIVRRLCVSIDAGSNGFTALKPGVHLDDALRQMKSVEP